MKDCKNPTCDRPTLKKSGNWQTYCSEACRWAMRTRTKGKQIPDLWVPMSMWWALVEAAEIHNLTVRDYVLNQIEVGL